MIELQYAKIQNLIYLSVTYVAQMDIYIYKL